MLIYITLSAGAFYFNEPLCHWPNWVAHDYGHRQMDKWMLTGNRTRTNLMTKPFVVVIRFAVSQFCLLPVTFLSWDRSIFAAVGLNSNKLCLERNRILRPNLVRAYGLMTLSSFSSNLLGFFFKN